jgi:poly(3-hydroxybutyrate) depolymerase
VRTSVSGLVVLALLTACRAHAAEVGRATLPFNGAVRTYYLYVPDAPKIAMPAIVLLHGSGGEGGFMVHLWRAVGDANGIILIAPNATNSARWNLRRDGPDVMHALVEAVAARYPIDRRRVYVFGYSAGAVYALTLAMLESEYFAAVAMNAGAWRRSGEFDVMRFARRKIPLAIVIGDRDKPFPPASVRSTETALKRAGFPIEVTVIPGRDHAYNESAAPRINAIAWTYLSAHRLDAGPVYVPYRPN